MPVARRSVDTDDLDEAVEVFSAAFTGGGMRLSEPDEDFRYFQHYAGTSALGTVQHGLGARVESRSDESTAVFVAWTDAGATSYRVGGRDLDGDAGLLSSGRSPVQATVEHAEVGSILIDRDEFETRARLLLGRADFVLPDSAPLVSLRHVTLVREELALLRDRRLDDLVMDNPLTARTTFDHVVAVVLAATGLDVGEGGRGTSAAVRRAVAFIDENPHRPVGVGDVAAAVGLSASGLTTAFRRELGETVLRRIRRTRLAQARRELVGADASVESVAAIAHRWGFTHLGRFARTYEGTYGELPSATLRS